MRACARESVGVGASASAGALSENAEYVRVRIGAALYSQRMQSSDSNQHKYIYFIYIINAARRSGEGGGGGGGRQEAPDSALRRAARYREWRGRRGECVKAGGKEGTRGWRRGQGAQEGRIRIRAGAPRLGARRRWPREAAAFRSWPREAACRRKPTAAVCVGAVWLLRRDSGLSRIFSAEITAENPPDESIRCASASKSRRIRINTPAR